MLLALALPALGTLIAEPAMGLVDTALVGRLGPGPLAALGGAAATLGLVASLLVFLEYGTTVRVARCVGRRDPAALVTEVCQVGWLATAIGLVLSIVLVAFPRDVLRLVDLPPDLVPLAERYLAIRGLGFVPSLWVRAGNGVFRGLEDTRTPLWITIGLNAVNAALDVVLIFGWARLGIPGWGIAGAAWAATIATWAGGVTFSILTVRRLGSLVPGGLVDWRPRARELRELLGVSRDLVLRTASLMTALFVATRLAAGLGTAPLAAHHVGWQLWIFVALVLDSMAIAGQAVVGRLTGSGDVDLAREAGDRLCRMGGVVGVIMTLAFLGVGHDLARLFTNDPAVLDQIAGIYILIAWMQIPNAVLFAIDGLLIGAGDLRFVRNAMVGLGAIGVVAVLAAVHVRPTLAALWIGTAVYMLARLAVMGHRWFTNAWAPRSGHAPPPTSA